MLPAPSWLDSWVAHCNGICTNVDVLQRSLVRIQFKPNFFFQTLISQLGKLRTQLWYSLISSYPSSQSKCQIFHVLICTLNNHYQFDPSMCYRIFNFWWSHVLEEKRIICGFIQGTVSICVYCLDFDTAFENQWSPHANASGISKMEATNCGLDSRLPSSWLIHAHFHLDL